MASRIKGITVEIGGDTTGLDKALSGTNKKISATQSQLRDVERLLKLDPTNTNLLEQKQRLLASAIGETKEKLQTLTDANDQLASSVDNYDAWKTVYDPIQAEIDITKKNLADLKAQQKEMADCGEVNTEAYSILTSKIQDTSKELRDLKARAKEVSEEFGNPISPEQFDSLQREIAATQISLRDLEGQAGDVDAKLKGIDDRPIGEVEDAAKKAEGALQDAGEEASNFADHLKAELIADAASGIVASLKEVAEESKEYRKIMASLDTSSSAAGYTAEETSSAYQKLYGVLGDEQSAATTLANLQALGASQEDLMTLIDGVIGGWAQYGDSIPIDGLAEAINETAKTGQATGAFADLLNWAGLSEETFNQILYKSTTEQGRLQVILRQLAGQDLPAMGRAWQENNQSLVESNQANANMQEQLAQLAVLIEPIITQITNSIAGALEWFNGLDGSTQKLILTAIAFAAAVGPVSSAVSGVSGVVKTLSDIDLATLKDKFGVLTGTVLPAVQNTFSSVFGFIAANPVVLLIGAIVALVALVATKGDEIQAVLQKVDDFLQGVFAKDWTEVFGPVLGGILNDFFATLKSIWDSIKQIFDGIIDFIRGVFTGDWERAWNGVKSIFSGIFSGLQAAAKAPINGIISLVNAAINSINSGINMVNKIPGVNIGTIGNIPYLASGGVVLRGSAVVGEAGPELLTVDGGRTIVQPLTNNTTSHSTNLGGVSIYVYGAPGQDAREVADIVLDEIQVRYGRGEAAFG